MAEIDGSVYTASLSTFFARGQSMANPALEKLGFKADDRVVIVHADDMGMCHAANVAFGEDLAFGIVTCGAVMMPCP